MEGLCQTLIARISLSLTIQFGDLYLWLTLISLVFPLFWLSLVYMQMQGDLFLNLAYK